MVVKPSTESSPNTALANNQHPSHLVIGTAGHIDHGKTSLVKLLTGIDGDKRPQEQERGITIDLGFSSTIISGVEMSFIDVPGHEKFIKNMVAGAAGMDAVILVVAADDGVMPQTREHFEICRLLGIGAGVVVVTKCDVVTKDRINTVSIEIRDLIKGSFLESAPMVTVSSKTQQGVENLKSALSNLASGIRGRECYFSPYLPIDRVFNKTGVGLIVTGTSVGNFQIGETFSILPINKSARVRSMQVHGKSLGEVETRQRLALDLTGVGAGEVERGMVVCSEGGISPTRMFTAKMTFISGFSGSFKPGQRIRVGLGTKEAYGKIEILEHLNSSYESSEIFAQIRFDSEVVAFPFQNFIIRTWSPQMTVAGGTVVRIDRKRLSKIHKKDYLLELSKSKDIKSYLFQMICSAGLIGLSLREIISLTGFRVDLISTSLRQLSRDNSILEVDEVFVLPEHLNGCRSWILEMIGNGEGAAGRGISIEELRNNSIYNKQLFDFALKDLKSSGKVLVSEGYVTLPSKTNLLSIEEEKIFRKAEEFFSSVGLEGSGVNALSEILAVDSNSAANIIERLVVGGRLVRVGEQYFVSSACVDGLIEKLREFVSETGDRFIDIQIFKSISSLSRKYAIPFLEYLDRKRITMRAGDRRLVI